MPPSQLCQLRVQSPFATTADLSTNFVYNSLAFDKLCNLRLVYYSPVDQRHRTPRCSFNGFSALVVYIQPFVHWVAAIILLAFYVAFRTRASSRHESHVSATSPSNSAIRAIVLTHAAITLPSALCLLQQMTDKEGPFNNTFIFILHTFLEVFLQITGLLTSLTAFIPQIHLMLTRPRDGLPFGQGSLSTLSLGLQVITFTLLAASQGWRTRPRPLPRPSNAESWIQPVQTWSRNWWFGFFFQGGLAAGWLALAVSQLVVLCVALGLGSRAGYIAL
ncbi:hypothetical protein ASPCAL01670 [Aspergillus calidoustus]|uniref:Uncharacterized protein n=1 Tax=Aspergillus calidoustus TaxID=454130 RepID=A0A0U5FY98_ASPCI|nr:hypothetical protein ASPCAL01670 [Aspergillus calidoustus]